MAFTMLLKHEATCVLKGEQMQNIMTAKHLELTAKPNQQQAASTQANPPPPDETNDYATHDEERRKRERERETERRRDKPSERSVLR
jgi:hypothetical protein